MLPFDLLVGLRLYSILEGRGNSQTTAFYLDFAPMWLAVLMDTSYNAALLIPKVLFPSSLCIIGCLFSSIPLNPKGNSLLKLTVC